MQGLYPNDASMLDSIGRLMIVALFVIIGVRNLQKVHIDDHVAYLDHLVIALSRFFGGRFTRSGRRPIYATCQFATFDNCPGKLSGL